MNGLCKRACSNPSCPNTTDSGKCASCRTIARKSHPSQSNKNLYGRRWNQARKFWLAELCECLGANADCPRCHGCAYPHRFCQLCFEESGYLIMAADLEVDHVIPHRGNATLFWDRSNWSALCAHHHSIKTAREDGGFGNAPSRATTSDR